MEATVRALRALADALTKRPDIEVVTCVLGAGATEEELAKLGDVPDELVRFYREVNGVHIAWRFIEPPGHGCIRIPPISVHTRFELDAFVPGLEALFFDEQQPECTTWLVRVPGKKEAKVFTGSSVAPVVSASLEAYLQGAIASGFVPWWPMCFRETRGVSYAEPEAAITRFRAKPKKPKAIAPGARVHIETFHRGARGRALRTERVAPSGLTQHYGTSFTEVACDLGWTLWVPTRFLKVQSKVDAYEGLREALPVERTEDAPLACLELLAHATSADANVAAGLLAPHELRASIAFLVSLYNAAIRARISFTERLPLPKSPGAFAPTEEARMGHTHCVGETFDALFAGLHTVVRQRSAETNTVACSLVEASLLQQLGRCGKARDVTATLRLDEVLRAPSPPPSEGDVGLPEGAIVRGAI